MWALMAWSMQGNDAKGARKGSSLTLRFLLCGTRTAMPTSGTRGEERTARRKAPRRTPRLGAEGCLADARGPARQCCRGLYLRPNALKLGAFSSKAERDTGEGEWGHDVLCLFLERGPQLSSEPQRRHGPREGWEPLSSVLCPPPPQYHISPPHP